MSDFWIKNISKFNVSLLDLGFTIKTKSCLNLLKNNKFTLEQLKLSAASGSLFEKRDKILILKTLPPIEKPTPGDYVSSEFRQSKKLTLVKVEEQKFEELELSDENFAAEFIEETEEAE